MLRIVLAGLLVACLSVFAAAGLDRADAQGAYVPSGSYLNSCKDVSFDPATNILTADCERSRSGALIEGEKLQTTPFNITGCAEGSIWNDNNMLYCLTAEAWGHDHVIPKGSYIDTCTNRRVVNNVLIAECGSSSGSRTGELNLDGCRWGGDISNNHGRLQCEAIIAGVGARDADASQPTQVVKPVAVEPGLVKPVAIVPLTPADPTATEDATADKKKKRRRDRAERG